MHSSPSQHAITRPRLCLYGTLTLWLALAVTRLAAAGEFAPRFYVDYSAAPPAAALAAFDWCILDPTAKVDLKKLVPLGHQYLAYVSAVEAQPGSFNSKAAEKAGVPVVARNDQWNSVLLDIENPNWLPMMLEVVIPAAFEKGFTGVFLDTLDSAKRLPGYSTRTDARLVQLIRGIRKQFPDKKIMINRGFDIIGQVASSVDGVLVESVYRTFEEKTHAYVATKSSDTEWLETRIRKVQAAELPVFVIDYVSPSEPEVAAKTAERLQALGCHPFISTRELQGLNLGPHLEMPRRILVVHGTDKPLPGHHAPPIDTSTATHFQAVLEWMGYELDFLDIDREKLAAVHLAPYAGVIVDELDCRKALTKQRVLDWLKNVKERGVPILFAGQVPFTDDDIRSEFSRVFGLKGDLSSVYGVREVEILHQDPVVMKGETPVEAHRLNFQDVSAPDDAEVFLSLKATDSLGKAVRFDPCFLAPWGGAWLEPYIVLRASQANRFFYADVFAMLEKWLHGPAAFPVPDTTTRDGRRLFYSHIDGDGFASLTHYPGHPTCAEVIRDRILKKYDLPVTVSIVEADIRGWLKTLKKEDSPKYVELARSMYALPHVQAGSHSFSHPFIWDASDPNPGHYQSAKTDLMPEIDYPLVNPQREIVGSIDYINKTLLPAGKQVEMMLWSGDCRPGEEALRICRELGVENMNGGDTIISRLYPSISGVGPRMAKWGNEIQIFAANQNEFMYAHGFAGPNFGGFADVVDTFECTESPRRLKPVNVYYHFYSATYLSSQRALERICDWCVSQPLHPITALQFASIVRDADSAKIYSLGARHWRIAGAGALRTYRFPPNVGTPDLARCKGISGYKRENGVIYVHTTGEPTVEIQLAPPAEPPLNYPHLVESSADIVVESMTATSFHFSVGGWQTATVDIGGLPPDIKFPAVIDAKAVTLTTNSAGQVHLVIPPGTRVAVDIPSEYALTP